MQPIFLPDQMDAHRLLVLVGAGRATADYKPDQKIFHQGDDANYVFFVQDGCVDLTTFDQ